MIVQITELIDRSNIFQINLLWTQWFSFHHQDLSAQE
jgi:hypothetical protein